MTDIWITFQLPLQARESQLLPIIKSEKNLLELSSLSNLPSISNHLCDMMTQAAGLNVLRAPEPSLKLHYEEVICDEKQSFYDECLQRRARSFGTRSQLANMVLRTDKNE